MFKGRDKWYIAAIAALLVAGSIYAAATNQSSDVSDIEAFSNQQEQALDEIEKLQKEVRNEN